MRIGFDIGLTSRLDISLAHAKGDEHVMRVDTLPVSPQVLPQPQYPPRKLYEMALKYQLLRQYENDPSHPIALSLYVQTNVSTQTATKTPNYTTSYENFGDRFSEVFQIILAKKIKKVSIQLNPTLVHYHYVPTYDEPTTFALGGAVRVPVSKHLAILVDYFHPFISDTKKNNYYDQFIIKFKDPLSIGFEIITAGHNFHLNFTNTTAILENQFIPYTTSAWTKGQFRWGFNLSRKFVLWRPKNK